MGVVVGTRNAAVRLMGRNLELHPDRVAYIWGERSVSYRELDRASRHIAVLLRSREVAPGDRVALALPDCPAFPAAILGCLLVGAVAVMAGASLGEEELRHVMADSGARLLIRHADLPLPPRVTEGVALLSCDDVGPLGCPALEAEPVVPHEPAPDEFAFMLYSSGSTGRLKGVPHHHASLLLPSSLMGEGVLGLTAADVIFSTSKLSFGYGLVNSLSFPLHFGATALLCPGKPDPLTILDIIRRNRATVLFAVPTVYAQLLLSCRTPELELPLRLCCSAGEGLPALLFEEWRRRTGLEIVDGMGASEFSHHFICNVPGEAVAGSTGRLVRGYRVRLVDDDGNDVPPGREGHLLVSGGTRAPRYWNLPELSDRTMLPDGFTRTGDVLLERGGLYYHRGRSDDMIKVAGQWVSPVQVEGVLGEHPAVAECAVTAVTVDTLARPAAFVVPAAGAEASPGLAAELRGWLRARLPDHMCPARFRFLEALPRTATGKVQRFRLRDGALESSRPGIDVEFDHDDERRGR